jgi:threonyl-tRNA synthetase
VVGDREQESEQVALREHRRGDAGSHAVRAIIDRITDEVKTRARG